MIVDALLLANPVFHFEEKIFNPAAYTNLTDPLISLIETSKKPELKDSQEILKRIRKRDIYRYVGQKILVEKDIMKYVN